MDVLHSLPNVWLIHGKEGSSNSKKVVARRWMERLVEPIFGVGLLGFCEGHWWRGVFSEDQH